MTSTLTTDEFPSNPYQAWYRAHGCDHAHCPYDCEHPQPFFWEGKLVCGRCWFVDCMVTEMVPCVPEVCE